MNKRLILALLIIFVLMMTACQQEIEQDCTEYKAKITNIDEKISDNGEKYQDIELEMIEGPNESEVYYITYSVQVDHYKDFSEYHKNDRVFVSFWDNPETGETVVTILNHYRTPRVAILFLVFLAAIVVIAGKKGLKTILALVLTIACIVFILIPMIVNGRNPILSALLCGVAVSGITLVTVGGFNRKTMAAVLGTLSGLVCATVLTLIVSQIMRISCMRSEDVEMIAMSNIDFDLDIRGIFTAGIFIGCLGAVMDVGMSLASSIHEIKIASPRISKTELFQAGMRVGQDIMGTMANTLILAYTGGALMQMVVWKIYGTSFIDMLNREYIVTEVIRALCGSFGMLLTIPITCLIAANIIDLNNEPAKDERRNARKLKKYYR